MNDALKLVQSCLAAGSRELEIETGKDRLTIRCHNPLSQVVVPLGSNAQLTEKGPLTELTLTRSIQSLELAQEQEELTERLVFAPARITRNGQDLKTGWDVRKAGYGFVLRRFFLADPRDAAFSFTPLIGARDNSISVARKLSSVGWKQDSVWPWSGGAPVQGPQVQLLQKDNTRSLLCEAMITVGRHDKTGIGWIRHGVWMEHEDFDLGFPRAFALCSANSLPLVGDRLAESEERNLRRRWLKSECRQLALSAHPFRGKAFPPVLNPLWRLGTLLLGGGASIYSGLAWPLLVGIVAGRGSDWIAGKRAQKEFWKALEDLQKEAQTQVPGRSSGSDGA